ncbi:protein CURVATURE THYLAKOID 1B, chloroplastic-like [Wolffia australiana]
MGPCRQPHREKPESPTRFFSSPRSDPEPHGVVTLSKQAGNGWWDANPRQVHSIIIPSNSWFSSSPVFRLKDAITRLHHYNSNKEKTDSEREREKERGIGFAVAMAYAAACAVSSSPALFESRGAASGLSVGLPSLSPAVRAGAYCRKIARNVVSMATGESLAAAAATPVVEAESTTPASAITPSNDTAPATSTTTETPEILKTIQEAWNKVEDKYAVSALAASGAVALWGAAGMISAIDRLPLVPGVLEVVGIGYSGWFAYKNLLNKSERDALLSKIKNTYNDIIGSSQ